MIYFYECERCGWSGTLSKAMDERDHANCPSCLGHAKRNFGAQVREQQFKSRIGWRNFTHYDLIPDEVKGAGPFSREHKEYRDSHTTTKEERLR